MRSYLSRCSASVRRFLTGGSLLTVWVFLLALAAAAPAEATTSGSLPWDNILNTIAESVKGPVLSALVIMGICAGGAYWFFTESQRGLVQIIKVLVVAGIVSGLTAFLGAFGISMALV